MESIEDKIAQLVDMGFTPEQAQVALKVSNNNVQTAISYLFEEPIEVQDEPSNTASSVDTVAIQNPLDIPDLSSFRSAVSPTPSTAARQLELEVEESDGEQTPDEDMNPQLSNSEHIEESSAVVPKSMSPASSTTTSSLESKDEPRRTGASDSTPGSGSYSSAISGSIFEKLDTYHFDSQIPKLVVPINPSNLENFYVPFVIILSQLSEFQNIIFNEEFQFKDYGWDANWYNKSGLSVLIPTTISKKQENAYRKLIEIQRIVGFLVKDDSKRLFISTWNLLKNLNEEFFDTELIEEIIPKIYESLNTCILEVLSEESQISNDELIKRNLESLFKSIVYSESEEQMNNIYHIDIESNHNNKNIYHSFNELIWGNEMEQLGQIYFTKLSDFITISKINELHYNHRNSSSSFQVLEEFYPQIYTKQYKDLIISLNKSKESMFQRKLVLVKQLNKLTFFEGKKLNGILNGTIQVFSDDDRVSTELRAIVDEIELEKTKINEELETLSKSYSTSDITNVENILSAINESEGEELEPYILSGVIQSQNEYCFRKQGSDEWVYVKFLRRKSKDLIEDIECVSFESFEKLMERLDIFDGEISTYTYVKKSVWEKTSTCNIPNGLKSFFGRDNVYREERNKEEENKIKSKEEGEEQEDRDEPEEEESSDEDEEIEEV
ncbi:hypothetical protein CLIB1423_04S02080 [[Candida] railenensis]|uniref:UBA domain-containing protein n=1 Tax=[Candida] railenensis TaxID=45579 RepID=A0A9P0QLW7_9ASCO|nr:hypothetical protein CLIB1423_04S02080 [[Candida] railenensis]